MSAELTHAVSSREEPTYPILDHDALVRRHFTAALAAVTTSAAAADRSLIAMRSGDRFVGALHGDETLTDLDGLPLGAIAAALDDDGPELDHALALLMSSHEVEHDVVFDDAGRAIGLIAVAADALLVERARRAVRAASASLAGWIGVDTAAPAPAGALLERIRAPVIVVDQDVVLTANAAGLKLAGHTDVAAFAGTQLGALLPRLPRLPFFVAEVGLIRADRTVVRVRIREHSLVVGGRTRRALLVEDPAPASDRVGAIEVVTWVDRVISTLDPTVRRCARVNVARGGRQQVAVRADDLADVLALAVLDAASALDERALGNRIDASVHDHPSGDVVVEITARGTLAPAGRPAEPVGAAVLGVRLGQLGGDLELATTARDRRVLRLVLPRAGTVAAMPPGDAEEDPAGR